LTQPIKRTKTATLNSHKHKKFWKDTFQNTWLKSNTPTPKKIVPEKPGTPTHYDQNQHKISGGLELHQQQQKSWEIKPQTDKQNSRLKYTKTSKIPKPAASTRKDGGWTAREIYV